jgi:hypothetical protein
MPPNTNKDTVNKRSDVVLKAPISKIPSRAIFITPPFSEKAAPSEGRRYGIVILKVCNKNAKLIRFSTID